MRHFPIILPSSAVQDEVYGATGAFVGYVNAIVGGGVPKAALPGAFLDLYALDFYYWQVCNGGHRQFVSNSDAMLDANLEHALRGCTLLGLPDLGQLLGACRDWCLAHPEERARLTGGEGRPEVLDRLDDRFFSDDVMTFSAKDHATFVASRPPVVRSWIEAATTRSSFRAQDKYCVAAGAWLVAYPGTRTVRDVDAEEATHTIICARSRPSWRPDRFARHLLARLRMASW